ncbi:MAG: nucleoside triphosphate pyrophosphohydrolase [Aestuariivita sp.]|nr:nucleoside triphosphate pyrophosphohydrolase [Aestuariivita sp.]MCY4201130.1 nucleoside triphosphate pyrophosphohydrolase [Aestuariivita sp.]MCY4287795.1 nucleoside triphosphate pyrophosphohydrolase [Aestuariivita sp.]MCY4345961.1 nucleoside triphosphate pyrophosphohydrolase [Aestuariivita sp.]
MTKASHEKGIESRLERLIEVVQQLRDPVSGCPWDREQTISTLGPYALEEAYEVVDAIQREDWDDLKEELGDLLLQVVFQSQIAEEKGLFDLPDVTQGIIDKMVSRHPHVFGSKTERKTKAQQTRDWEEIKASERSTKAQSGILAGVPIGIPALTRAQKLQDRAARVGFDWPSIELVLEKVAEEVKEIQQAKEALYHEAVEEEFGDLLFVLVSIGRHLGVNSESALRKANQKFISRLQIMETTLKKQGRSVTSCDLNELEELWQAAKATERDRTNNEQSAT